MLVNQKQKVNPSYLFANSIKNSSKLLENVDQQNQMKYVTFFIRIVKFKIAKTKI